MNPKLQFPLFALALGVSLAIPQLRADVTGADPGLSGAPGDQTCTSCHGTGQANIGSGSVKISFANGATYTPGQTQKVTVTVADPSAKIWGFEASPRVSATPTTGAGTMATVDTNTQLRRSSGTLQWITHTRAGTRGGTSTSASFDFNWTAPATAVGNIDFYMAGNAGNNNNNADSGDKIYTAKATLTPASASGNLPVISDGGVTNAFSNLATRVAPGSWVSLYGKNLSSTSRTWASADFTNNTGPTSLDGVSATVNGKSAALNFISPTQVNIQVPFDAGTGTSTVVLTNSAGSSNTYSFDLNPVGPGLLAPASFLVNGKQYVVAQFADGAYVGPAGFITGLTSRPAKAGDTVVIYGVGFGALQTAVGVGQIVSGLNPTQNAVTFSLGSNSVTPSYAGAAPGFVGAYQFNLVIPSGLGSGDVKIDASVGGMVTGQTLYLTLE